MRRSKLLGITTGALVVMGLGATPAVASSTAGSSGSSGEALVAKAPRISNSAQIRALRADVRNGTAAKTHGSEGCAQVKNLRCDYQLLTTAKGSTKALTTTSPAGYGATDLESAYQLTNAPSSRNTIVIIDAGAYPNLEADLGVYRAQYGLPLCTTQNGCFSQENYQGGAPYTVGKGFLNKYLNEAIGLETALDVQMASAACPKCKITEIQVPVLDGAPSSQAQSDRAVLHFSEAVKLAHTQGASAVSISYGYPTSKKTDMGTAAKNMSQPGTAVYGSTGDSGYNGPFESWPADLTTVIAAGGTSLFQSPSTARGWYETAWADGGSGCTPDLPAANGQPASIAANCNGRRAASDISAVADLNTGVAVYDTFAPYSGQPYEWVVVGGTSVSSPLLAGMNARAGVQSDVNGPNYIYAAPSAAFNDVVYGNNTYPGACAADGYPDVMCDAGPGWDGPTGNGSPVGLAPFYLY